MTSSQSLPRGRSQKFVAVREEVARRTDELSRRMTELQKRRAELRMRREQLRVQRQRSFSLLVTAETRAAAELLLAARRVADLEKVDLWLRYFAMGGASGPDRLEQMLQGERPLYRIEHDRLCVALNEAFRDAGMKPILATWDGAR